MSKQDKNLPRGLTWDSNRQQYRVQFRSKHTKPNALYKERLPLKTTRRQAEQHLAKLREDDRLERLRWPSEREAASECARCLTVAEFAHQVFIPHCALKNKPSTIKTKKQRLVSVAPWFEELPLDQVTRAVVAQYQSERKEEGLRNHTINLGWSIIRELLQLAYELEYITQPPPAIRHLPTKDSKPHRALNEEEAAQALCNALDAGEPWYAIALFALHTGARWADMMHLRWSDLDLDAGQVHFRAETSKTHKDRLVPLLPEVVDALSALPQEHEMVFARRARSQNKIVQKGDWIALRQNPRTFGDQKYPWEGDDPNLHFGPHVFRHTFATWKLQAGVSIVLVSRWLGHANIQTTVDIYGHIETANTLEEMMRGPRPQARRLRAI